MFRSGRIAGLLATCAAAALLAAACGSAGSSSSGGGSGGQSDTQALGSQAAAQEMGNLYQQAQQKGEKQVVVYGADVPALKTVYDTFSKRYPSIKVEGQLLTGTQFDTRLDNEFLSGKHTADLLDIPGNAAWRTYSKQQLDPWMPASANGLRSDYQVIGPGNAWVTPYQKLNGILYNSDQIKQDQAPKSWMDLLQSKWRGKVVITDPRQIGASSGVLVQLTYAKLVPETYIQQFHAQQPVIVPHAPQVAQKVGGGQSPLAIPYGVQSVVQDQRKGAPEALALNLKEGAQVAHSPVALVKGAAHPDAAKLLEAWMFTPEGQRALASEGFYGTMPGSPAPKGFPSLSSLKQIPEPPPAEYDQVLNQGIKSVGTLWGA